MTPILRTVLEACDDAGQKWFPYEMYLLLTTGRRDKSGAWIDGCGLTDHQALGIIGIIYLNEYIVGALVSEKA